NLAEYLARMVLPLNATSYMIALPAFSRAPLQIAQAVLALIMPLSWAALLVTRAPRWAKFAVWWMALSLLPVTFFVTRTSTRYLYGPSIGYCILVAGFLSWWWEKAGHSANVIVRSLPALALTVFLVGDAEAVRLVIRQKYAESRKQEESGQKWLR